MSVRWLFSSMSLIALSLFAQNGVSPQKQPVPVHTVSAATSSGIAEKKAFFDQYCVGCHNDKTRVGNFSLQNSDLTSVGDHGEKWEKVIRKLRAGMMPPPGLPRPSVEKYNAVRDWLEARMDEHSAAFPDPGSVVLHRLNRTEYGNAIRDLLDLQIDPTLFLPADGTISDLPRHR